jgi:hypothetical protein
LNLPFFTASPEAAGYSAIAIAQTSRGQLSAVSQSTTAARAATTIAAMLQALLKV